MATTDIEVEFDWKIRNWPNIQLSRDSVAQQVKLVEVGPSLWEFYFLEDNWLRPGSMMFMRLVQLTAGTEAVASTKVQLLEANGVVMHTKETKLLRFTVDTTGIPVGINLAFGKPLNDLLWRACYINAENELVHRIKMKVTYKIDHGPAVSQLREASTTRLQDNLETLLGLEEFQNFKIIANDGKEFMVNKHILACRCPVFESMLWSNMEETKTGQVHVEDVSGPAMKILIQFWYTGKLSDNWKEPGVVNDFVSAVGKYGISELLEFLDTALGEEEVVQSSMELAEMTKQLDLKKAEKGVVKKLARNAAGAETVDELYGALGISS